MIEFTREEIGLALVALKGQKEKQLEKAAYCKATKFYASEKRHKRHAAVIETIEFKLCEEMRAIRSAAFERHRKSLKYLRGVQSNDRLIK